nr:polyamine aminopropyltransferase [Pseudenhygromyxa sp. WMMC2535]
MTLEVEATLFRERTRFQHLEIVETAVHGRMLLLDGIPQLSSADDFIYHECLVHPALLAHAAPRRVGIIGGGDGGALQAALRHACVEEVVLVEIDAKVLELSKRWFPEVHGGAFDDPRFELVLGDGRAFLADNPGRFDAILLDLTDATGPARMLYTQEFYAIVQRALRPGGVVGMQADSPFLEPEAFGSHVRTTASVFEYARPYAAHIPSFWTRCAFALLSDLADPQALDAPAWAARLEQRGVEALDYLTPELLAGLWALPRCDQRLIAASDTISTDAAPFEIGVHSVPQSVSSA